MNSWKGTDVTSDRGKVKTSIKACVSLCSTGQGTVGSVKRGALISGSPFYSPRSKP